MSDDKKKVLYIEDNAANRALVVRLLEATGQYEVLTAVDGESGLAMVQEELPCLVLVDLDVPGVNGFEVARLVTSSPNPSVSSIPVAAVSANVMKDERSAAYTAGCVAFIEKPFDIRAFRTEVGRLIAGGQS